MATDVPPVRRTIPEVVALANSVMGMRWPNSWWPSGNSNFDDCAAYVSWLLWGLRPNGQPWETIVSGIIERSGMTRRTDINNMRQGDLVGMEWGADDNYDHIEWFDGWIEPGRSFRTLGTNAGPSDAAAVRTRYVSDVKAFARPAYPSPNKRRKETDMQIIHEVDEARTKNIAIWIATPVGCFPIATGNDERAAEKRWNELLYPGTDLDINGQFSRHTRKQIDAMDKELRANVASVGTVAPTIDYAKLAEAIKASGALDLIISGTARPAATV